MELPGEKRAVMTRLPIIVTAPAPKFVLPVEPTEKSPLHV